MGMQDRIAEGIFEGSPDCVKVLDHEGRVLAMNRNGQCAMEIDDFEAVRGMPWSQLWPEENHQAIDLALQMARDGGTGRFSASCPTAKGRRNGGTSRSMPCPAAREATAPCFRSPAM